MSILILDNERTIRKALGFALRNLGYKTLEARNAVEALELISIDSFDLIVVDLNLPVISGLEFLNNLKESGKNIPTLILTSQKQISQDKFKYISKEMPLNKIVKKIINELNHN
jgi:two-component system response regulator